MAEKKRRSSTCHCIQLRRAASRVTERYDMALAPAGLTVGQYSLLAHLERLEPVSVSRLAEELELERTTLVRTLKPVLARQLVADAAEPGTDADRGRADSFGAGPSALARGAGGCGAPAGRRRHRRAGSAFGTAGILKK